MMIGSKKMVGCGICFCFDGKYAIRVKWWIFLFANAALIVYVLVERGGLFSSLSFKYSFFKDGRLYVWWKNVVNWMMRCCNRLIACGYSNKQMETMKENMVCMGSGGYFSFASVNTNSSPPPWLFLAEMLPPWIITAFFTIASPNPVPPSLRERPLSTR